MHIELWDKCLLYIKDKIPEQSFKTWFEPIVPIQFSNPVLTIQVPSQFFYEWLEDNYVSMLKEAIQSEIGDEGKLEYSVIVDKGDEAHQPYTVNLAQKKGFSKYGQNADKKSFNQSPFSLQGIENKFQQANLNGENTFESYIEGDCNRLARSAAFAVAAKPGSTSFNPLMIYGGVKYAATVFPEDIFAKFSVDDIQKSLAIKEGNYINYFDSRNTAFDWLRGK